MKAKRTKLVLLSILALALASLIVTCPGRKAHREALIDAVGNALVEKANLNLLGNAAKTYKAANYNYYNSAINPYLKVKGYVFFSIGYINAGEQRQKVSFGILGYVYIKDKDIIYRKIPMLAEPMPVAPQKEETTE